MPQLGRRTGFAEEHLGIGRIDLIAARYLQGHQPIELRIASLPNSAKPTCSKLMQQLEVSNGLSSRRVGRCFGNQAKDAAARGARNVGELLITNNFHSV